MRAAAATPLRSQRLFVRERGGLFFFDAVARGLFDFRNALYFLSVTVFFLLATVRSLESRKWK